MGDIVQQLHQIDHEVIMLRIWTLVVSLWSICGWAYAVHLENKLRKRDG